MTTILFTHPWHGSFNNAILKTVTAKLDKERKKYQVIDLPKDNFNPLMEEADLKLYRAGKYNDPLVGKYQDILRESEEVVFIFPIWWGMMPADLKGFLDKVLLVNFSHSYENGWTPLLKNIKKTTVLTTSESPTDKYKVFVEDVFLKNLYSLGFQNGSWLNCEKTAHGTNESRVEFLKKVEEFV